jgi:acyl-CoA reductase-like NAD-dependent aldehyde dehydrogenase
LKQVPLIIGGKEIIRSSFNNTSLFYGGYSYNIADAGMLEIAQAIGNARNASRPSLDDRTRYLQKAADAFPYSDDDVEHAVRMLGMPISIVKGHFEQIPHILRGISLSINSRFRPNNEFPHYAEKFDAGTHKILLPEEGFCYVVTPGNDVRAVAMVAANLCCLGLPFIIKASKEDAVAPLVIKALIDGGFDPRFCNLVYFDITAPDATKKHFKILDACSVIWTFGSDETVDRVLRYERIGKSTYLDITDLIGSAEPDYSLLGAKLSGNVFSLKSRVFVKEDIVDHFDGKKVLRHGCGNCAMVVAGAFDKTMAELLYQSFGYAIGCNAVKSVLVVGSSDWISGAAMFLADLITGDPLDPHTQVGYVNPATLDYVAKQVRIHVSQLKALGGERLSAHQAKPLLIHANDYIPEFFGQEIPAYILAVKSCQTIDNAIEEINAGAGKNQRLAVSFVNIGKPDVYSVLPKVKAHSIFINAPTTTVFPYFHEGNDYALRLSKKKLVYQK